MKSFILVIAIIFLTCDLERRIQSSRKEQIDYRLVGGPCEGCDAIFEFDKQLHLSTDTLPDFQSESPGLLLTGMVYKKGTKLPAEDVILYIYHTNKKGKYPKRGNESGWGKRHGYLRGWIRTNSKGEYNFYTQIPGAYPERNNPQHIHLMVLEPSGKYYYLEDFLFENDPLLKEDRINRRNPRGGEGYVVNPRLVNGLLTAHRDLELGKNIPDYDY